MKTIKIITVLSILSLLAACGGTQQNPTSKYGTLAAVPPYKDSQSGKTHAADWYVIDVTDKDNNVVTAPDYIFTAGETTVYKFSARTLLDSPLQPQLTVESLPSWAKVETNNSVLTITFHPTYTLFQDGRNRAEDFLKLKVEPNAGLPKATAKNLVQDNRSAYKLIVLKDGTQPDIADPVVKPASVLRPDQVASITVDVTAPESELDSLSLNIIQTNVVPQATKEQGNYELNKIDGFSGVKNIKSQRQGAGHLRYTFDFDAKNFLQYVTENQVIKPHTTLIPIEYYIAEVSLRVSNINNQTYSATKIASLKVSPTIVPGKLKIPYGVQPIEVNNKDNVRLFALESDNAVGDVAFKSVTFNKKTYEASQAADNKGSVKLDDVPGQPEISCTEFGPGIVNAKNSLDTCLGNCELNCQIQWDLKCEDQIKIQRYVFQINGTVSPVSNFANQIAVKTGAVSLGVSIEKNPACAPAPAPAATATAPTTKRNK